MMVFDAIRPLVGFEILDFFGSEDIDMSSNDKKKLDIFSQVADLGYDSSNIFYNLKSVAIVLVLYVVKVLVWSLFK
jgi:hypothetical protein